MKYVPQIVKAEMGGRAPHGARGLKCLISGDLATLKPGRAPHGARGLKYPCREGAGGREGRAPRGAHGLK